MTAAVMKFPWMKSKESGFKDDELTDSEEEFDPEDLPPVRLPDDLPMQVVGFEEELGQWVANEIVCMVRTLSRYWSLNNLVGVTVADDYAVALAG